MNKPKTIFVCGGHPDDYEIGMGGTIHKLTTSGAEVYGIISCIPGNNPSRLDEAEKAAAVLGMKGVIIIAAEGTEFAMNRETIARFEGLMREHNPEVIFTHWTGDSHQDHVALTQTVFAATRKNTCAVLLYEQTIPGGITGQPFSAQLHIDVSEHIIEKTKSLEAHHSQVTKNGPAWIDSIIGRTKNHGYKLGIQHAEVFEVAKIINDLQLF